MKLMKRGGKTNSLDFHTKACTVISLQAKLAQTSRLSRESFEQIKKKKTETTAAVF